MIAPLLELLLLAGAVAAPLLPAPYSFLALAVALGLWLALRPPRREVGVAGLLLAVALGLLVADAWAGRRARAPERKWVEEARGGYTGLWRCLWREARTAAGSLRPPADKAPAARLAAFRRLAEINADNPGEGSGRRALLLLDPDGAAVAWAGEGLLHELRPEDVPARGAHYVAGFSAVTLLAVEPFGPGRRPWRVVAGASFPSRELPFGAHEPLAWSLVSHPSEAAAGALQIGSLAAADLPAVPLLVVARAAPGAVRRPAGDTAAAVSTGAALGGRARQLAWAAIGLALLALGVMRGIATVLPRSPASTPGMAPEADRRSRWALPLALAGVLAWGAAAAVPWYALAALAAGLALAGSGLRFRRQGLGRAVLPLEIWIVAAGGAVAALLVFAAAWGLQAAWGPLDLAAGLLAEPAVLCLRLALTAAAFGLLSLAAPRNGPETGPAGLDGSEGEEAPLADSGGDGWAWLAVLLLAGAAALTDDLASTLVFLAAGGAATALWVRRLPRLPRQGMAVSALVLLAAIAAAAAAESAYRWRVEAYAASSLLDRLSPPTARQLATLKQHLASHLAATDLASLAPRDPSRLERQDLAFALWRGSPLARRHALSAVVVEPRAGQRSSFSFGLPLTPTGEIDRSPARWEGLELPHWRGRLVEGQAVLSSAGKPWAVARYWLLPRPGYQLDDPRGLGEVESGLLKGAPEELPVEDLPRPALFALYDRDGRAALSPWEEAPPLDPRVRAVLAGAPPTRTLTREVRTPSGRARVWARAVPGGWEAVYVPRASTPGALERAGNFAVGTLAVLALAVVMALLFALPRAAFRDGLRRTVRSYSKRLLLVYTVLLLLPLLLLNVFLVRAIEERLERGQRAAGEQALRSAQKALGGYILGLEAGFGIDTALNDGALAGLSDVVRHEVNLYWGSSVYASSRHELFTAGLLPKRIPGEIYSRLVLRGYDLSSRTNRAGGTEYLELYAPFRIPGVAQSEERLFLSMPLLAQQEEAARELAHLRRHALLATVALFTLLVAVGSRLARNFTRPLTELVEGTRRIAAGAPSLEHKPTELELAALVEAVDQMARSIALGRERLLREKQVVERVVETITSGVVSVDSDGRVLMHNRVAADLLGVAAGDRLAEAVEREPRLAPVAEFLRGRGSEMARTTVRLCGSGRGGGEDEARAREEGEEREWTLIWAPVPGEGEPAALLVVEDATEILRGQRLLAWAEMARIIAHEIKNPLTPIRLSAEHMREVYQHDPEHFGRVFERCTTNILSQVDELRSIASEFSAYSAIPQIDLKPGDLTAAIADLVEAYRAAPPEGVAVELEGDGAIPARFDAKLLGRAVRNLLENALRASAGGGRVVVRVERLDGHARVAVADSGPGVAPDLLGRIFDPYFSTHDTGTGLGLPIARRIAEEHGGNIAARNRAEGGLEVAITLPLLD